MPPAAPLAAPAASLPLLPSIRGLLGAWQGGDGGHHLLQLVQALWPGRPAAASDCPPSAHRLPPPRGVGEPASGHGAPCTPARRAPRAPGALDGMSTRCWCLLAPRQGPRRAPHTRSPPLQTRLGGLGLPGRRVLAVLGHRDRLLLRGKEGGAGGAWRVEGAGRPCCACLLSVSCRAGGPAPIGELANFLSAHLAHTSGRPSRRRHPLELAREQHSQLGAPRAGLLAAMEPAMFATASGTAPQTFVPHQTQGHV